MIIIIFSEQTLNQNSIFLYIGLTFSIRTVQPNTREVCPLKWLRAYNYNAYITLSSEHKMKTGTSVHMESTAFLSFVKISKEILKEKNTEGAIFKGMDTRDGNV